jgi:hypothetical protein
VVDADERRLSLGEPLDEPLSDPPASPLFPRAGGRLDFVGNSHGVRFVNTQTLAARPRRLCAGVVDADVAIECGVHVPFSRTA